MVSQGNKNRILEIIRKDSYITGLAEKASPKLAEKIGCKPGDLVGCAVFSLAVAAGRDPKEIVYIEGIFTDVNEEEKSKFEQIEQPGYKDVYDFVAEQYGLTDEQVSSIWNTNDRYQNREERLEALEKLIKSF